MGESYRGTGEKEFYMNWIQRENRLPKERVSFLSWTDANREKQEKLHIRAAVKDREVCKS